MNVDLTIREQNITRVRSSKFVGLIIDDELHSKEDIKEVCNKISKSSGILRKLSGIVPCNIMKNIYLSIVYPYLVNVVEYWGR